MHAEHLGQAGQLQHPQYSCLRGGQQDPAASPPGAFRRHGQSAQGMAGGELHSLKVHDHALPGPYARLDRRRGGGGACRVQLPGQCHHRKAGVDA